jgi:nucleoside-diphosphate-sugar epimerase
MKVIVTGGAGYMGSLLTSELLQLGHAVSVVDDLHFGGSSLFGVWAHPRFEFIRLDIRDRAGLAAVVDNADAVVHLAAVVGDPACARDPELAREVNRDVSLRLLEDCRAAGISHFIFASTCSNYGRMADPELYMDEECELNPLSLYAETKVEVERAVLVDNPFCVTVLRFATLFGLSPRMRFDLTVNEFTLELLTKRKLLVFGEQFWRPYVHVRDAARAVRSVLENAGDKVDGQVFNVGSTAQNYRKQDLVDMLTSRIPDVEVEYVRKEEDPRDYRVSFEKVKDILGFVPTRSVEDGVAEITQMINVGAISDFDNAAYRN